MAKTREVISGRISLPEVSGAVPIPGEGLLVASDEHGIYLVKDGLEQLAAGSLTPSGDPLRILAGDGDGDGAKDEVCLEDVEDACCDADGGSIYLITSHARNRRGRLEKTRCRLARLTMDPKGGGVRRACVSDALFWAIMTGVPQVASSVLLPPARGGLNIEGLAWDPDKKHLVVGLRAPTFTQTEKRKTRLQEDAVLLRIINPDEIFEDPDVPAKLHADKRTGQCFETLDLNGQGIRGMAHDPDAGGFWILSGLSVDPNHEVRNVWELWFWDGKKSPKRVKLPKDAARLQTPEAVCVVEVDGKAHLLLVEDREADVDLVPDEDAVDTEKLRDHGEGCPYVLIPRKGLL